MEIYLIIILAGALVWLGYRLAVLRKGIEDLTQALKRDLIVKREQLPESTQQDRLSRLSAAVIDVTSEADLMRALETGHRKILDYLLNQIEDALFIVDEQQEIKFSNEAAKVLFPGKQSHQDRPLMEICRDHRIDETVQLAINAGGRMQDKIRLANDHRMLFVEAGPVDPSYRIGNGAWLLVRDITAQFETEQIRKDFVANASHELRTPLAILTGYLEILDEEDEDQTIEVMKKHTDRLTRIVEDMLTISKLETDDPEASLLNKEVFDIGDCIHGIVERLNLLIERFSTKVSVELPSAHQREFFGDRFYWDQVFFNLIENALKQNPREKLKIVIRVKRKPSNGRFYIDVIDNGVGIPTEDLDGIFKRFYKVDKNHSSRIKGTGLGLSIVKRAVEAHHGTISVTSKPGERTCFHLSLPAPPLQSVSRVDG